MLRNLASDYTMMTGVGNNKPLENTPQRRRTLLPQHSDICSKNDASGDIYQVAVYKEALGEGGTYGDCNSTVEAAINEVKHEIKSIKQEDVASLQKALGLAQQAKESAHDSLARLGAQGERIRKYVNHEDVVLLVNSVLTLKQYRAQS
jgi:hypothetical protein